MPLVFKWQGYRKICVNCILEIHVILNMSHGSQYTKILQASGILILSSFTDYIERVPNVPRVLNMLEV